MAATQNRIRVQLDFDQQGFDELESLKADLRAGSRADAVRFGLGLLRWAVNQLQAGSRILVEKDGELSGVVFPFLPEPQVRSSSAPVALNAKAVLGGQEIVNPDDLTQKEREHTREVLRRTARDKAFPHTSKGKAAPGTSGSYYEEERG